jgi:hypothetical protein
MLMNIQSNFKNILGQKEEGNFNFLLIIKY